MAVQDSTTLERVSDLRLPAGPVEFTPVSLAFSPDGCLLACTYDLVAEPNMSVLPLISLSILTFVSRLNVSTPPCIVIWDIQTGMVIKEIPTWKLGKIAFSGDQSTVTLMTGLDFHTYDGFSGEQVCKGKLLPSSDHNLGCYWVDEKSLLFAISFEANGELVINIQELRPSSDPPLFVVKSFTVPHQVGRFSFSPVSSHASFVTYEEVVILNVQDSKVLLQVQQGLIEGYFSLDGCYFIGRAFLEAIYIWENTSDGYVLWNILRPRLSWESCLCSPKSISILCWGNGGIQLLHSDGHPSPSNEPKGHSAGCHLVAYSEDRTYIITLREGDSIIRVLNLSDTTQQSINTDMEIRDIKTIGNTIFVTDWSCLVSWNLATGGQAGDAHSTRRESTTLYVRLDNKFAALSNDCSKIAFAVQGRRINSQGAVFLYDVQAQKVLDSHMADGYITDIQFSPDGHQVRFVAQPQNGSDDTLYCLELGGPEISCFANSTIEHLEDGWSLNSVFPSHGDYCITGNRPEWVCDSRSNVLWLPPNWRSWKGSGAKWDGNFLALIDERFTEPIIIEFQPQATF